MDKLVCSIWRCLKLFHGVGSCVIHTVLLILQLSIFVFATIDPDPVQLSKLSVNTVFLLRFFFNI